MRNYLVLLSIFINVLCSFAQNQYPFNHWTEGTAFIVEKNRIETGLIKSSRIGISPNIEISAHPLTLWVYPKAAAKIYWASLGNFNFATEHGISYPTLLMQFVSTEGTGGIISPELYIPTMLSVFNGFLISSKNFNNSIITFSAGLAFSIHSSTPDERSTVDLPIIFPRLSNCFYSPVLNFGLDLRGRFTSRYGWQNQFDAFRINKTDRNVFIENRTSLVYFSAKDKIKIKAGFLVTYGEYPFGNQWHLLPHSDLSVAIRFR